MKSKTVALIIAAIVCIGGVGVWLLVGDDSPKTDKGQGQNSRQDPAAPLIELDIPQDGLLLSQDKQVLQVALKTADYNAIARVEYLVDGNLMAYSTKPPFSVEIDISKLSIGQHTLQAVAYTSSGKTSKSETFVFVITEMQAVQPANDETSRAIVRNSNSISHLQKSADNSGSSGDNSGGNNSGDDGGNNGGGDDGGPEDPGTPWPDIPPAMICGNNSILGGGPVSAPAGAVVVPAGDNDGVNFRLDNATYWFAPGTHTLSTDPFGQIIPGNNSTFIGAPGAVLDGQGLNRYAFTQTSENVTIKYLTIQNFATPMNEGAVNHDSGEGWTIEYSTIQNNGGAGVFGGTDNKLRYNCLKDNGQYGFQVYTNTPGGPQNVLLDHNEIAGNNTDDWESQISGCGCTGGGKFWEASHVTITNNYVHDNLSVALWADTNDNDFLIEGNYIEGNDGQGIFYEIAYNMIVRNNTFIGNANVDGPGNPSFPTGAIYLSEAGGDARVPARTDKIEIYNNQFVDNWSGVVLWENADRFCNSPANTSGGTCTMVNPDATLATCNDPALGGEIENDPYYDDCRWKTNNVKVHNNVFSINKANIPGCSTNTSCGFQGIFSNIGTFPTWSPYTGDVIQQAITFQQGNEFRDNTYVGDWNFRTVSENTVYNFAIWQAAPFNQDVGSTYNGEDHLVVRNAIDEDSATLEGSIGEWIPWFSANVTRSNAQAHTGSYSLQIQITAEFGWGARIDLAGGYPITPGEKRLSFWAKLGGGTNLRARMDVQWRDAAGDPIGSTVPTLSDVLNSDWQEFSTIATPPSGAKTATLTVVHSSGQAGDILYLDDFVIGDNE